MAYTKQTWVDGTTPIDAEHMNHIEDGVYDASIKTVYVDAFDESVTFDDVSDMVANGSNVIARYYDDGDLYYSTRFEVDTYTKRAHFVFISVSYLVIRYLSVELSDEQGWKTTGDGSVCTGLRINSPNTQFTYRQVAEYVVSGLPVYVEEGESSDPSGTGAIGCSVRYLQWYGTRSVENNTQFRVVFGTGDNQVVYTSTDGNEPMSEE